MELPLRLLPLKDLSFVMSHVVCSFKSMDAGRVDVENRAIYLRMDIRVEMEFGVNIWLG